MKISARGGSVVEGKKQNFFAWYYEQGIHELFEIIKNYFLFVLHFFSIGELLKTLFFSWHRDITPRNWRGWHPIKALERLFENMVSRVIGALVRLVIICCGLSLLLVVAIIGILLLIIWISFPLFILMIGYLGLNGSLSLSVAGITVLGFCFIMVAAYLSDQSETMLRISIDDFYRNSLFDRVCERIGTTKKELTLDILHNETLLVDFLKKRNITIKEYQRILQWELISHDKKVLSKKFWRWENLRKNVPIGMQWRFGYTVNLDRYAIDLSESDPSEYRDSELIGRENQLELLELILQRPDQNCILLVGASGIGKKTLVHAFGKEIRHGKSSEYLHDKRILLLDLGRAISDAVNYGRDVENEIRALFMEAAYAGNVILAIEHIEHYLGKDGNVFHPNLAAVLEEFLAFPSFQLIATSTVKEYHQLLEKQEGVVKYFEVVEMQEPEEEKVFEILLAHLAPMESEKIVVTYGALREIIRSSNRYNWEFPLPERAIDLMMNVIMYWQKDGDTEMITEGTVTSYLSLKTGMPQGEIQTMERKKLLDMEKILHRHVIGQDEAIKQIAQALRRARSGIGNNEKPVGSFLFMGPTGVGKTETAKALAKVYYGDEKKMIRFDMSEYQTPASIDRLLGSQTLNQPGQLVTKAKDNPYGLLLLDELEKAYPDVLDVFLQILDEGFVTDAFGEKINFRNMIIIATSNAGSQVVKELVEAGQQTDSIKQQVIDYVVQNSIFRLEFLNRFNDVIFFSPLNDNQLKSVVKLQLKKFSRRLNEEKNIEIEFGDEIVEQIINKGYNPIFGARSLNRYIEETVEDLVARKIIEGDINRGEKIVITL